MHCTMLLGAWRWHWLLILLLASSFLRATAQSAISRLPATIPLALKSPYFNSWLPIPSNATEVSDPGNVWPVMWQTHLTGWIGFIRVDGRTYQWLGIGGVQAATPLGAYVTPTQTIFRLRAGPVDFNVTYLSPVEPSDWARQSFPFSYVSIDVVSGDGENHAVQIYTDVNGEWISPSLSATTRSTTTRTEHVIFHSLQCVNTTTPMAEDNEIALDSTLILASPNTNTVTTQTGPSANVRAFFDQNGGLSNAEDGSERPISPMYPAISIAVDLGGVSDTSSPAQALFAVGVLRDPVVQYSREGSSEEARRPYFLTKWSTVEDALEAFLEDFPAALSRATELDARIMSEARSAGSEEYVDLVGLSLRQVVASFDITTSEDPDAKDVKAFLKDIGTSSRANPVDALYASTPALLYLNPSLVGILLDPLLEAQSLSSYPHPYAVPDLGAQYPIATRIESEEHRALGLDSSASMLIMTYLHAQKSGEGHLLKKYHGLLKQWADFLVEHAASPSEFVTSDGLTQANNANLALKGILGVHAMSLINQALEKEGQGSEDTAHYAETAERLYTEWKRSAFISGRVISSYGQPDSWSSACNLYLARLLGADFVEDQIFDGQTAFLSSQLAATRNTFGLGHDSNDEFTVKSHWTMFTAATMTDTDARNRFVSIIHNRTFLEGMTPAFATTWDARSASTLGGRASPAQGAMFALMATSIPDKAIQFTSGPGTGAGTGGGSGDGGSGSNSSGSKVNLGAIVGGAVGGLAALAFTILAIIFFIRKRKTKQTSLEESKPSGHTGVTTPPPVQPAATTQESTPGTVSSPLSNQSPASQVFVKPPLPPSASLLTTSGAAPSSPAPPSEGAASILAASTASSGAGRRSSISKSGSPLLGGQSRQQPERERPLSEAEDLRAEVLALRREMEEMRARTALSSSSNLPDEPPPQYSS